MHGDGRPSPYPWFPRVRPQIHPTVSDMLDSRQPAGVGSARVATLNRTVFHILCSIPLSQVLNMSRRIWKKFLYTYRDNPCMWDPRNPHYKDRAVKEIAEQKLLSVYNKLDPYATIQCVKKKIDTFRCSWRREYKRMLASMNVSTTPDSVYCPKLWYFDILSFLKFDGDSIENMQFSYETARFVKCEINNVSIIS